MKMKFPILNVIVLLSIVLIIAPASTWAQESDSNDGRPVSAFPSDDPGTGSDGSGDINSGLRTRSYYQVSTSGSTSSSGGTTSSVTSPSGHQPNPKGGPCWIMPMKVLTDCIHYVWSPLPPFYKKLTGKAEVTITICACGFYGKPCPSGGKCKEEAAEIACSWTDDSGTIHNGTSSTTLPTGCSCQ